VVILVLVAMLMELLDVRMMKTMRQVTPWADSRVPSAQLPPEAVLHANKPHRSRHAPLHGAAETWLLERWTVRQQSKVDLSLMRDGAQQRGGQAAATRSWTAAGSKNSTVAAQSLVRDSRV
jgi:hypothetical protein